MIGQRFGFLGVFLIALLLAAAAAGCGSARDPNAPTRIDDFDYTTVNNNHLTLYDLAVHFKKSGLDVVQIQPLRPDVLRAMQAIVIAIAPDGTKPDAKDIPEIGAYYYNTDVAKQREILAQYHKDGFAYILGVRFPVFQSGSFVLTGVEGHPKKKEIVAAFRSFK